VALTQRSKAPAPIHGKPCSIALVYAAVADTPDELAELNAILYEEGNNQAQVFKYLTDDGYVIGFQSVNTHRGMKCRCWRETTPQFCAECKRDLPSCVCA
jgi:hypothetical protein